MMGASLRLGALLGVWVWFALPATALADDIAVDAANSRIRLALTAEPPQLDSTQATDQVSGMVLGHVMEGLMRYDANNNLVPGIAAAYERLGQRITFTLRRDAKWSDGLPVTAHDFVFAWRRALDPDTGSQYAFILYPLQNAEAINKGELPPEALGVHALSAFRLQVNLRGAEPNFLQLLAFQTYLPVREDFFITAAGRYAADADQLLYNGPFVIAEWIHGARLLLARNPHYYDQESIHLQHIDWAYFTTDQSAVLNLFRDGAIATTDLSAESLSTALRDRLRMQTFADGSVFYLGFNYRPGRPTGNLDLRRALHLVFNPRELVSTVIGIPGYRPGLSLFPLWLKGERVSFRSEYPATPHRIDIAAAKVHLARARAALGVAKIPPLVFLVGDSQESRLEAEYFQNLFYRKLGLQIKIDAQIFKQRLAKMTAGEYDIVGAGWGPDYDDPMTFGDLFSSWNENNRGRYVNPALDAQVRIAENTVDQGLRMAAFGEIQRILYAETVIIPTYERSKIFVTHPQLQGVRRRVVGPNPDFSRAFIVPPVKRPKP